MMEEWDHKTAYIQDSRLWIWLLGVESLPPSHYLQAFKGRYDVAFSILWADCAPLKRTRQRLINFEASHGYCNHILANCKAA